MRGPDPRRLVVGEHADADRHRASWLGAMEPFWHVVVRSSHLTRGSVAPVALPMDRFALAYRRALADLGVPSSIQHNRTNTPPSNPTPTPEPVHA